MGKLATTANTRMNRHTQLPASKNIRVDLKLESEHKLWLSKIARWSYSFFAGGSGSSLLSVTESSRVETWSRGGPTSVVSTSLNPTPPPLSNSYTHTHTHTHNTRGIIVSSQ